MIEKTDVCESPLNLSIDQKPNTDDIVFDVKKYLDIIIREFSIKFENSKWNEYSLMDVLNFRWAPILKLIMLLQLLKIDISNNDWIPELNTLYVRAVNILKKRYWKKIPKLIELKTINSINDIKSILEGTWKTLNWVFNCALSKFIMLFAMVLKDQRIVNIWSIHNEIIRNISLRFNDLSEIRTWFKTWFLWLEWDKIKVNLLDRPKSIDSIIWKMMWNIDYNWIDDFFDLHWCEIKINTNNKSHIILALQDIYFNHVIHNSDIEDIEIENKWIINENDINNTKWLDPVFKELLLSSLRERIWKTRKKQEQKKTNHKYEDIKIKYKYKSINPIIWLAKIKSWVEIKFTIEGNENEKWLAFQPIFDWNKKFRELTRAFWFIRVQDIIQAVNIFFENLDEELQKKWKNRDEYMQELIDDLSLEWFMERINYIADDDLVSKTVEIALYNYYEKWLKKVKPKKNSKKFFYIHPSYLKLTWDVVPEVFLINND